MRLLLLIIFMVAILFFQCSEDEVTDFNEGNVIMPLVVGYEWVGTLRSYSFEGTLISEYPWIYRLDDSGTINSVKWFDMKYIIDNADRSSLVIIDEPGMGTDPDEGAALAMAIIDTLTEKEALVAVSTHYNRLKSYGLMRERVENACMVFDNTTKCPSFSLQYGTPGTSYAFEVAENHGIKSSLLTRARGYLDQDEVRLNRLIDKLNNLKQEVEKKGAESERARNKYHAAREKLLITLERIESDNRVLNEKKRKEADSLISEAREELKDLINLHKNRKIYSQSDTQRKYKEITERLANGLNITDERDTYAKAPGFKEGQIVCHKSLPMKGKIISIDTFSSKAVILSGNIKLSVNTDELMEIKDESVSIPDNNVSTVPSHFPGDSIREINLIGYRVDEALPLIDKLIDRSMIEGDLSLRIVHGYGTGTLKTAIRRHLKKFPCIKRIGGADPKSGGEAITIVELH